MSYICTRNESKQNSQRGDGLVEFALLLPVLMLIVMSIIDLGRAVYAYTVVANSAREAARYGVVAPNDTTGMANVAKSAGVGLDTTHMTVTISNPTSDSICVIVSYEFHLITPLVSQVLSGRTGLTLTSETTMYTGY